MAVVPVLLLIVPVCSTLVGGLLALRFRASLTILVAVGAGLLLGAAFLDLLPEAISIGSANGLDAANVLGFTLLSFLAFLTLQLGIERVADGWKRGSPSQKVIGRLGGSMLIFHSFRDGMAIGLSYAMSHPAGYAVAAGIAAHDIGDGMNTVILTTRGEQPRTADYVFLAADCVAPLLGGLVTMWWTFSVQSSVLLLAAASGFFLQMATSDFLPEIRQGVAARKYLLPAVFFGAAAIYVANLLIGRIQ